MPHKIKISAPAALALVSGLLVVPHLLNPADLWRNGLLEAQAFVGLANRYEVTYEGCANSSQTMISSARRA